MILRTRLTEENQKFVFDPRMFPTNAGRNISYIATTTEKTIESVKHVDYEREADVQFSSVDDSLVLLNAEAY